MPRHLACGAVCFDLIFATHRMAPTEVMKRVLGDVGDTHVLVAPNSPFDRLRFPAKHLDHCRLACTPD